MEESKRERAALTAEAEQRILKAMARRLPRSVHSDHLTIIGVLGAVGVAAGYVLSNLSPHWLWLSSAMLAVNWFGDSLDGCVARVRHAQRPRYGYYLDHAVDAFTTALIGIGIGLSPYVSPIVGFAVVVVYLMMSINVYLESRVYNVFRMDYGPVGPTEARIVLVVGNTLLIWAAGRGLGPDRIEPTASAIAAVLVAVMGLLLLARFASNLRRLAREDPLPAGPTNTGDATSADGNQPETMP